MAKINNQKLSRIITSRECMKTTDRLIEMYDRLTVAQRLEIKTMLIDNKNNYDRESKKMSTM